MRTYTKSVFFRRFVYLVQYLHYLVLLKWWKKSVIIHRFFLLVFRSVIILAQNGLHHSCKQKGFFIRLAEKKMSLFSLSSSSSSSCGCVNMCLVVVRFFHPARACFDRSWAGLAGMDSTAVQLYLGSWKWHRSFSKSGWAVNHSGIGLHVPDEKLVFRDLHNLVLRFCLDECASLLRTFPVMTERVGRPKARVAPFRLWVRFP